MDIKKDVFGKDIEVGDLIAVAVLSKFVRAIVLGYTKQSLILSCHRKRISNTYCSTSWKTDGFEDIEHDNKYYEYRWRDMLIIEKNFGIPENLRKFVKQF
jgi:hypothetical protein